MVLFPCTADCIDDCVKDTTTEFFFGDTGTFPQFQSSSAKNDGTFGPTHTVPMPSGIESGDKLILFMRTSNTSTLTTPTGWTSVMGGFLAINNDDRFYIYEKDATGSEAATLDVTSLLDCRTCAICYRLTNAGDLEYATNALDDDPPELTTVGGSAKILWFAVSSWERSIPDATVAPTGYSNLTACSTDESTSSNSISMGAATKELESDTENPGLFTWDSPGQFDGCGVTVAVYPA